MFYVNGFHPWFFMNSTNSNKNERLNTLGGVIESYSIHRHELSCLRSQVCTVEEMIAEIRLLENSGYITGFFGGCFDLLHLGHMDAIVSSAHHVDYLFMAVASDKDITNTKGPKRPVYDEVTRVNSVARIQGVHRSTIFRGHEWHKIITQGKPSVVVRGSTGTYAFTETAKLVEGYGGKTLVLEVTGQYSTSQCISRVLRNNS
jgi:cytidyltransferase-like protein